METKICSKCKKELPATNEFFSRHKRTKLNPRCKECRKADYLKTRDIELQKRREKYHNNIEHYRLQCKKWRDQNKELKSKLDREYRQKNKDKVYARQKIYAAKNRDKININSKRYSDKAKQELLDSYIILTLRQSCNLKSSDIKKYPHLIEAKREQIKLLRLTKNNYGNES